MPEKHNVVDPAAAASGGEYALQAGFGWTNGVWLALRKLAAAGGHMHTPVKLSRARFPTPAAAKTAPGGAASSAAGVGTSTLATEDAADAEAAAAEGDDSFPSFPFSATSITGTVAAPAPGTGGGEPLVAETQFAMTPRPPLASALRTPPPVLAPSGAPQSAEQAAVADAAVEAVAAAQLSEAARRMRAALGLPGAGAADADADTAGTGAGTGANGRYQRRAPSAHSLPAPGGAPLQAQQPGATDDVSNRQRAPRRTRPSQVDTDEGLTPPVYPHALARVFTFPEPATPVRDKRPTPTNDDLSAIPTASPVPVAVLDDSAAAAAALAAGERGRERVPRSSSLGAGGMGASAPTSRGGSPHVSSSRGVSPANSAAVAAAAAAAAASAAAGELFTVQEDEPDTALASLPPLRLRSMLQGSATIAATVMQPWESTHTPTPPLRAGSVSPSRSFTPPVGISVDRAPSVSGSTASSSRRRRPLPLPEAPNVSALRQTTSPAFSRAPTPPIASLDAASGVVDAGARGRRRSLPLILPATAGAAAEADTPELILTITKAAMARDPGARSYCVPEVYSYLRRVNVTGDTAAQTHAACICPMPNIGFGASLATEGGVEECTCTAARSLAFLTARGFAEYRESRIRSAKSAAKN